MEYLEFEKPIEELDRNYEECIKVAEKTGVKIQSACEKIRKEIERKLKDIYKNLTPWQRVQVSRHPDRPYTLDYIAAIAGDTFFELHGDRQYGDDKAMVGGLGKIDDQTFMLIGMQKGRNTKERRYRRFGMPNPEGYRKALRLMKLAERYRIPVVTLIDTPGAYPGIEAEERGQGEAIARNIMEMSQLETPTIVTIIGEGASGGALGIGVGDRVMMMENTWYSVIAPESCSSILWRSWEFKEKAAEALKLTAKDMKKLGLIDEIIPEPVGGAHRDWDTAFANWKTAVLKAYKDLKDVPAEKLIAKRTEKFNKFGVWKE